MRPNENKRIGPDASIDGVVALFSLMMSLPRATDRFFDDRAAIEPVRSTFLGVRYLIAAPDKRGFIAAPDKRGFARFCH